MHALSIIVPFYNSEEYITECISYIKRQRNQDFELILVNDGSTDRSEPLLDEALADYDKKVKYIKLETNQGHAHARNVGMQAVETPYFMFVDADDKLATYAVNFYLKHIQSFDGLIAPVHEFTLNMPQFVDQDRVQIKYLDTTSNPNSFLRKNTACNIIFKTAIVKGHNLQFNESLKVYTDWSFILDYVQYAEHFIRVINFPFYFKGEVYDPFETNTLSEQNFDFLFEDYAKSFIDALSRVKNKQTRTFIKQRMLNTLHNDFSPNLRETAQRFATHQDALAQVVRHLGVDILKEHKILFTLETFALAFRKIGWASSINRLRFVTRHAKRVALRQKGKELSKYFLTDKDENVNNKTVVFESFGGKNYSDSP
ncbi:TPA: glycosyltransferase, partial [Staphylococcus pseudintermedius]|nr:glycosyltransferase [Staphylococcus pseudintermedius]